ncbi:MAG: hypothetical protein K2L12_02930 [Clostridia bacterium]|nr:hypothetical protein [Clostridia bacterium]
MKFKHSINVFIDNFSVTYKQLLYRLIITVIAFVLYALIITPYIKAVTGSPDYIHLVEGVKEFLQSLVRGNPEQIGLATDKIESAAAALLEMIAKKRANIAWGIVGIIAVHAVEKFFSGLGNYAAAAVINDKMALRANSPFLLTLVRNLKEASLYNLMYVPLSLVYDGACYIGIYFFVFKLLALLPFVNILAQLFLAVTAVVVVIAVKMTFTSDWLPSLIRGKAGQKKAFVNTFNRKNKKTFNVLSNFLVLVLIVFAVNMISVVFTFGSAALLTIPSSYIIFICFEFVNYYDREELKYFIDKNTIIKPEKEHTVTREQFFRGE